MSEWGIPQIGYKPITAPGSVGTQGAYGGNRTQSGTFGGGNPFINNSDMQDFMGNLGNCNPNHPVGTNLDPNAGPVRRLDFDA